jgi:putative peptidoglycan lipid II flippase
MIKGFRQIASLTFVSRIFGMLRDIVYTSFLGANALTDAWFIAFKIPNLARRLFGEGAASASFIPVYSEVLQRDKEQAQRLANTVVTVIFVLVSALALLGVLGMFGYRLLFEAKEETKLIFSLCSVMLPYTVMICTVAILAGILNVHRHFAAPAAAPIVLNIFIIASVVLSSWLLEIPNTPSGS